MPMSPDEILSALNEMSADDRKAFAERVVKETPDWVKPIRSKYFAAGKREVQDNDLKKLTDSTAEAQAALEAANATIAELKAQTPNLEERDKAWQKKLEKAEAERQAALAEAQRIRDEADASQFDAELARQPLRPTYQRLMKVEMRSRIRTKPDGTKELLDSDGVPVEVPKGRTIWQHAAEMAKAEAPPEEVLAAVDRGGGATAGAGGGFGGGKVTLAEIANRKRSDPAFSGL